MRTFASPKGFAEIVTSATFAPMFGKDTEELLRETLEGTFEATPAQAKLAARVMATIRPKTMADLATFDPLLPTKEIAGYWKGSGSARAMRPGLAADEVLELRDDFTYILARKSGPRTAGVYVAGYSEDGYLVALCDMGGTVEEMRVSRASDTARLAGNLLTHFHKLPTVYKTLAEAGLAADLEDVATHIRNGASVNQLYSTESSGGGPGGFTSILHLLVFKGRVAAVEALLDAGADPNIKDSLGRGTLDAALGGEQWALVETLLKHGADVNERFHRGCTALHIALMQGQMEVARVLVKHGADREVKNDDGLTPNQIMKLRGLERL
jgi:hypothetical protein